MMDDNFYEWAKIENYKPLDPFQTRMLNATRELTNEGKSANVNYLMNITGLNWQQVNAKLNGLVMRGHLIKINKKEYKTKL